MFADFVHLFIAWYSLFSFVCEQQNTKYFPDLTNTDSFLHQLNTFSKNVAWW